MRRQQDDNDRRIEGQQLLEQLDAVHARHLQIGQGEIKAAIFGKFQGGLTRSRGGDIVSGAGQYFLQNVSLRLLVVNYQYSFSWHRFFRIAGGGWWPPKLAAAVPPAE